MSFDKSTEKSFRGMFGAPKKAKNQATTRLIDVPPDTGAPEKPTEGAAMNLDDASDTGNKGESKTEVPAEPNAPIPDSKPNATKTTTEPLPKPKTDNPFFQQSRRGLYRVWPRDPKGPFIPTLPESYGKQAGNGVRAWGATIHDLYRVDRMPTCPQLELRTSGSRLAQYMRSIGEIEHAKDELSWADDEAEPEKFDICDIRKLVTDYDDKCFASIEDVKAETDMDVDKENATAPVQNLTNIPFQDVKGGAPPDIQSRIPLRLLPQKLHVHDPWNILAVNPHEIREWREKGKKWEDVKDVVRVYDLFMDKEVKDRVSVDRELIVSDWKAQCKKAEEEELLYTFDPDEDGNCDAPVAVPTPLPLCPQLETPDAHLYLSPTHRLGVGNHSFVYTAEWELPRNVLFEPELCHECICGVIESTLRERGEADKRTPRGRVVQERTLIRPALDVSLVHANTLDKEVYGNGDGSEMHGINMPRKSDKVYKKPYEAPVDHASTYEYRPAEYRITNHYEGPVIKLTKEEASSIRWQSPHTQNPDELCEHLKAKYQRQHEEQKERKTFKVRLAAKLSISGDRHLEIESANYARFQEHFFEHWTGLNIIPPLIEPVPVGALVPQYYGYYTPAAGELNNLKRKFLSPILLLEKCGEPIEVEELSRDERDECASLFFRFHCAGWAHNSVFPRNIVAQTLPDTSSSHEPKNGKNSKSGKKSFRLIDFGRAVDMYQDYKKNKRAPDDQKYWDRMQYGGDTRMREEGDILKMFRLHHFA